MTDLADLTAILTNRPLLLAIGEQVAPSMNGAPLRRLAATLDELRLGARFVTDVDKEWLRSGAWKAETQGRLPFWEAEVQRLSGDGIEIISCADPSYPLNLAMVHDRPPLLFVRGTLTEADERAVAVVGTRRASEDGVRLATRIAAELAASGITIVSGLAKGIDTAAHSAAINAGGRTIAVYGTTIDRVYPAANKGLARSIIRAGACVSQFLPTTRTGPWCFAVRNITTSGLSLGTVVVEAGETSGAKMQAEAALAHGKRVFLVESLTREVWAQKMAANPQVTVASNIQNIVDTVGAEVASHTSMLI
ncbi:MAG: DNA-protecting protein DprA [bacterium]|nr:DNA-protecting protein DprA [bacterium]